MIEFPAWYLWWLRLNKTLGSNLKWLRQVPRFAHTGYVPDCEIKPEPKGSLASFEPVTPPLPFGALPTDVYLLSSWPAISFSVVIFFRPFLFITNFGEPEFKLSTMKHLKGKQPFRTEVMWKAFFGCLFVCLLWFFLLLFLFLFLPHRLIILFLRGCCISKWVNEWMNE